jgi:hypothetical protein
MPTLLWAPSRVCTPPARERRQESGSRPGDGASCSVSSAGPWCACTVVASAGRPVRWPGCPSKLIEGRVHLRTGRRWPDGLTTLLRLDATQRGFRLQQVTHCCRDLLRGFSPASILRMTSSSCPYGSFVTPATPPAASARCRRYARARAGPSIRCASAWHRSSGSRGARSPPCTSPGNRSSHVEALAMVPPEVPINPGRLCSTGSGVPWSLLSFSLSRCWSPSCGCASCSIGRGPATVSLRNRHHLHPHHPGASVAASPHPLWASPPSRTATPVTKRMPPTHERLPLHHRRSS